MQAFWGLLDSINNIIWANWVLYTVLGVGVLFTLWSGFCQYRALTHGTAVIRGIYDDKNDPGAINHFQALSAALSATVGLGNIAGVGVAVALGGPGAVFWMWMVGLFGMAIKTTEVCLSMLYRDTTNPDEPHGGPMFVAARGFKEMGLGAIGKAIGGVFVVTLLISTITGGNMFQAWSVGEITEHYFKIPSVACGIVLAVVVGLVIIGGIKRIGAVAGRIVPLMCGMYLLAALVVLSLNLGAIPGMLVHIVEEAFSPTKAEGAFLGGTAGYALLWGMKRALFSSESGQGSSPIAHSAAKTDEPVREAIVAGLEPFIDTIVVCTMTALVIMCTGTHNRGPEAFFPAAPSVVMADADGDGTQDTSGSGTPLWTVSDTTLPQREGEAVRRFGRFTGGEDVFVIVSAFENRNTGLNLHKIMGATQIDNSGDARIIAWRPFESETPPVLHADSTNPEGTGLWVDYPGPSLTGHAFDAEIPGLGKWLVTLAAWLFALSTMISWSYYGEQGIVFLFGEKLVLPYKFVYCIAIVVAASGIIRTDAQLDSLTALGTGVMLWANIPIMLIFSRTAMGAYHKYVKRLKAGDFKAERHAPGRLEEVIEGRDVR
jgi:AGCS family alanine or glycine:cation symporter